MGDHHIISGDVQALAEGLQDAMMTLWAVMRRSDQSRLAAGTLTTAQLSTLVTVCSRGPIRVTQLAEHEGVRPATISVALDRLEALGLVMRTQNRIDSRSVLVRATQNGMDARNESLASRIAIATSRLSHLEKTDLDCLINALSPLRRLVEHADEQGEQAPRASLRQTVPSVTPCDRAVLGVDERQPETCGTGG